jgi:hypothetical protein
MPGTAMFPGVLFYESIAFERTKGPCPLRQSLKTEVLIFRLIMNDLARCGRLLETEYMLLSGHVLYVSFSQFVFPLHRIITK